MTLALYGKSRRRKLILLFAAMVAVAVATLGGATLRSAGPVAAEDGPDLVATKTNNVGGTVAPGGSFVWTITLANVGNQDAVIPQNNEIFTDYLPNGVTYAIAGASGGTQTPTVTSTRATFRLPRAFVSSSADFRCELLDAGSPAVRISCLTTISNGVRLPAGATLSLDLEASSLPDAPATLSNPRDGQLCRIDPTDVVDETDESAASNDCADSVLVEEQSSTPTSQLNVKKYVWNGTDYDDDAVGWDFRYQPMGETADFENATPIEVDEGANVSHGQYRLFENIPAGYRLMGYTVAAGGASCLSAGPQNGIINQPLGPATYAIENVTVDVDTTVCVYNQPVRTFTVKKMVSDGTGGWTADGGSEWNFRLGATDVYSEADDVENGAPVTIPVANATPFAAFEKVPDGWALAGWDTVPGVNAECPSGPSNTFTTPLPAGEEYSANLGTGGDVTACFYNEEVVSGPTTNGLTIKKMVWNGVEYREFNDSWDPDFNLRYGTENLPTNAVSVEHGVTTQVPFAENYYVWENIPGSWQRNGWSNIENPSSLECDAGGPAGGSTGSGPTASAGFPIGAIDEETSRLICLYNQEMGELTVKKMVWSGSAWVADTGDWGFRYRELVDADAQTNPYDGATPIGNNEQPPVQVPLATYYVYENLPAGWQAAGYRLGGPGETCEGGPVDRAEFESAGIYSASLNISDRYPSATVCFYNERALEPVTVTKMGTGTYGIDWEVTKEADESSVTIPDDGSDTTEYTVTVDKSYTNISASGTITIKNPNPVAIDVNVDDSDVTLGGGCNANGDVTVPAANNGTDGEAVCSWSVTMANSETAPTYSNTASITGPWGDTPVIATSSVINFTTNDPESVTLTDDFAGDTSGDFPGGSGVTVNGDDSFTYTGTHTCDDVNNWNTETGVGTKTVTNTATLTRDSGYVDHDSANVTVSCERPKLTVEKSDENGVDPQEWTVAIAGQGLALGQFSAHVPSGSVQSVTESGPSGFTFESLTCVIDGTATELEIAAAGSFTMPASAQGEVQDVTCTFVNVADVGTLIVNKVINGLETTANSDDGQFIVSIGDVDSTTISDVNAGSAPDGSLTAEVPAGETTIGEAAAAGTNLANYTTTLTCTSDDTGRTAFLPTNLPLPGPSSYDINVSVGSEETVTCTYTNVRKGRDIILSKVTEDASGAVISTCDAFELNVTGWNSADLSTGDDCEGRDDSFTITVPAGQNVEISEVMPPGQREEWRHRTSVCSVSRNLLAASGDVVSLSELILVAGETSDVACTFTNRQLPGTIDFDKDLDWNGVPEADRSGPTFEFCVAGPFDTEGEANDLRDDLVNNNDGFAPASPTSTWTCKEVTLGIGAGGAEPFDDLVSGYYVAAEKDPRPAWEALDGPQVVNLPPGGDPRATIENQYQLGDLRVVKTVNWGDVTPENTDFEICITGPAPSDVETCETVSTTGNGDYNVDFTNVIPGDYTVSETDPGDAWNVNISPANITVAAGQATDVIGSAVTNTRLYGDLQVSKTFDVNGGTFLPGTEVTICVYDESDALVPFSDEDDCNVFAAPTGGTETYENLTPGADYTVKETVDGVAYASSTVSVNGADPVEGTEATVTVATGETQTVAFSNTLARASLTICKVFLGDEDSVLPTITINPDQGELPEWGDDDCFEIEVGANTPLTVAEVLPDGYLPAQEPTLSGQCTIQQEEVILADFVIAQTLSFLGLELNEDWLEADLSGIPAGGSCEVTFTNEPVGELVIVKDDRTNTTEPVAWLFDVTDGEDDDVVAVNGSGTFGPEFVATGGYAISEREVDGLDRVDVCQPNSPAGSYEVSITVTQDGVVGAEVPGASVEFTIVRGKATTVTFLNRDCGEVLGEANLLVRKFAAAGENVYGGAEALGGWTMTLECVAGQCESVSFPGQLVTDNAGIASFLSVPSGVYELCEVPQSGYDTVGSLLDGGSPVAGTCREVTVSSAAAGADGNIVVDFFNYEIPEDETPTPENTPTVTPTPEIPEITNTPTPTNTPETPETPTNTPDPTETPASPTETPTATPTPIDEVEGGITPGTPTEDAGEQSTPIPPASGTGSFANDGGSMLFALLGGLAILVGATALVAARRC